MSTSKDDATAEASVIASSLTRGAVVVSTTTVTTVHNPYTASKKSEPPELSNKPLHKSFKDPPPPSLKSLADGSSFSVDAANNSNENGEQAMSSGPLSKAAESSASDTVVAGSSSNINLPNWQRLPSRNLTFQSAEILTVVECAQHLHRYSSVRVTGVLMHRCVYQDMISLVLGDPLDMSNLKKKPTQDSRRSSVVKTPAVGRRLGTNSVYRRKTPPSNTTTTTPGLMSRSHNKKRPLSSTLKKPPPPVSSLDALVSMLQEKADSCVWVLANPTHVSVTDSSVGDLVTVLGEVQSPNDDSNGSIPTIVQHVVRAKQNRNNNKASDCSYYLQARMARNANGTNMTLYTQALIARRRHLLQHMDEDDGTTEESLLRLGCGLPP